MIKISFSLAQQNCLGFCSIKIERVVQDSRIAGYPVRFPRLWSWWERLKLNSSENIWKELDVNDICCMEWAQTNLKPQVRETLPCNPFGLFELVFDTGLDVTPLMGHLGWLPNHCSVPVVILDQIIQFAHSWCFVLAHPLRLLLV